MVLVKVDETIQVKGKQTITITKDHTFEVTDGDYKSTIDKGKSTVTISTGDHSLTVSKGASLYEVSQGNHDLKVDGGNNTTTVSKGNDTTTVSLGNIKMEASAGGIDIKAAQAINIESSLSIKLTVGGNTLTLDNTGVKIDGIMLAFSAQALAQLKSPMTTVSGDGMLTLKGGIMMIN
jgi:type VI secretion system secreted protein VgrG